ncbi:MAG: serine/threonine protein kinase [Planctomycetes bacterium]|nr:serine/threonine protein kinase [Planctomycetota bacterium]
MLDKLFQKFRKDKPTALPGYTALGVIHQGSMSTIFKARHQDTGRIVAVKVHKPEARRNVERLEAHFRDFTEGEITAAFDHPNVVKCLEHGNLGPTPYLVLEYVEGMTLVGLLGGDGKRLDGKRMAVIRHAAEALSHVHKKRFVHHDVCPKNLFVTNEDVVKLIDFGLACPLLDRPMRGMRMGTTEILAPEVLRREPCTYKVDVFAWGVVAYQVLSGHWPFESPDHHQTLNKILNVHPIALVRRAPEVPEEVSNLVMRALHKDPSERLANMTSALSVLRRHGDVAL